MRQSPVIFLMYILALCPGSVFASADYPAMAGRERPAISPVLAARDAAAVGLASRHAPGTNPRAARTGQDSIELGNSACRGVTSNLAHDGDGAAEEACLDAAYTQRHFSIQLGKRIGTHDDVLGEFDGVRVDLRLAEGLNLNGIAGYPVLAAEDVFNTTRQVFGISVTTERFSQSWDMNGYLVEQQEGGQIFGRSVGGTMRYLHPEHSLLVYLDYDVEDYSLAALLASGAWKMRQETTLSATLGLHSRPLPDRQQKYLQRSMAATDGWDWSLPAERLASYGSDGTRNVGIVDIGLSHTLSRRIKLSGDVLVLDAGTPAAAASSGEFLYQLKLSGKDLILPGDKSRLGLRRSVTEVGRTDSATLDGKYTINPSWELIPQLRADYHSSLQANTSRWEASPNVKIEYRRSKDLGFRLEAGSKLSDSEDSSESDSRSFYFVSLGIQAEF